MACQLVAETSRVNLATAQRLANAVYTIYGAPAAVLEYSFFSRRLNAALGLRRWPTTMEHMQHRSDSPQHRGFFEIAAPVAEPQESAL